MQPYISPSTFIFLISTTLCLLVGLVLLYYSFKKNLHNIWLAAFYITSGYGFFTAFLLYTKLIALDPWVHLYRTGYLAAFLIIPFSFFYVRAILKQTAFSAKDLIHFLPSLIFIIDFIPFYILPTSVKIPQAQAAALGLNTIWQSFSQGWLGIGVIYVPLRIILLTIYFVWQLLMIRQTKKVTGSSLLMNENKQLMQWIKIFCYMQILFFVPYYVSIILGAKSRMFVAAHTFTALGTSFTIILLMIHPAILYGLKGALITTTKENDLQQIGNDVLTEDVTTDDCNNEDSAIISFTNEIQKTEDVPKQVNYLPLKKLQNIDAQIMNHLTQQKSFLKKGYTTRHLATEMNIQPYLLSAVINQIHQTNFNDYLNGYRIGHAKTLLEKGDGKLLTFEALAEQCGFNNRNSFTTAFKKHTGLTPSAYMKGENN